MQIIDAQTSLLGTGLPGNLLHRPSDDFPLEEATEPPTTRQKGDYRVFLRSVPPMPCVRSLWFAMTWRADPPEAWSNCRDALRPDNFQWPRSGGAVKGMQPLAARAARSVLCAGHVQQSGGESPLCNLMEVKHE